MNEYAPPASIQDEVLAFLLTSPTPQHIIQFHASELAQQRLQYLLEANRQGLLTPEERAELEEASQLNHLIMLLKAKAHKMIQAA